MESAFYPISAAALALGGCAIMVWALVRQRQTGTGPDSRAMVLLIVLAAVSVVLYSRGVFFLWTLRGHMHDQVHYVLNSKYYDELGQFDLYPAVLIAAFEEDLPLRVTQFRDMHTYELQPVSAATSRAEEIRNRFTPTRWTDFKRDVTAFNDLIRTLPLNNRKWQEILLDKGYNATPAWTVIAGAVSNVIGIRHKLSSAAYASLDVLLLAVMFVAISRAYGGWCCAIGLLFLGCNHLCKFVEIGGGFLRFDWIAALMIGLCALRNERHVWAGVLIGYACAVRVFPAMFAVPIGVLAVRSLIVHRKLQAGQFRFLAAFALTVGVLLAGATLRYGPGCWGQFREKIQVHVTEYGFKRIGLEIAFLYTGSIDASNGVSIEDFEEFKQDKKLRREYTIVWIRITQAIMFAGWGWLMLKRRMKSDEAAMLGFVLVCTLLSPTRYYYIMLLAPVVVLTSWWPATGALIGLLYLFASQVAGHLLERTAGTAATRQFVLCLLTSGFAVLLMGIAYGHRRNPTSRNTQ